MSHADRNNILYPLQHGFRSKRSCETQLLEFVDDVSSNMSSGKQTDVLVMDFSKVFDKVSHSLLIHKLNHYGIRGKTNTWIQNFLSDWTQAVVVDGETSSFISLFLFYINDMSQGLSSTVKLFADDTIVYFTISSDTDAQTLQSDLDKLGIWKQKWKWSSIQGNATY